MKSKMEKQAVVSDEKVRCEIRSAIELLSTITMIKVRPKLLLVLKDDHAHNGYIIPTKPFLSLCYFVLQVLGLFSLFSLILTLSHTHASSSTSFSFFFSVCMCR